jgi:hypothetical protein
MTILNKTIVVNDRFLACKLNGITIRTLVKLLTLNIHQYSCCLENCKQNIKMLMNKMSIRKHHFYAC